MTCYVDVTDMQRLVAATGVERMLSEMGQCIRDDLLRWPRFSKSARTAHHASAGVIELMPVGDDTLYAFKYVNGHPANPTLGLPTVMALGVLAQVATGLPLLLAELTITTALRTAAVSVLAAQVLARPGSRSLALIGNGAQAEFQGIAFMDQLGITELRVFDIDAAATAKLVTNLQPWVRSGRLRIVRAGSVREAVRGANIVTTVTAAKCHATVLTADMVEPGMHLNAVGGDCPGKTELDPAILHRARVVVEYEPQTRLEGEVQQMPADFPVQELWQVLAGRAPGRTSQDQVTLFDSVGFALEDLSALRYIRQLAEQRGIGTHLALVPDMPDPKDLFGCCHAAAREQQGPSQALNLSLARRANSLV